MRKQFLTALLCAAGGVCSDAAFAAPGEYEVKAAFIHNIAKYVEWPAATSEGGSLRLCVAGRNPFGDALEILRGKAINSRVWEVVEDAPASRLSKCHALFIAASESAKLASILDSIKDMPVLTLADSGGGAEKGVMVNFYLEQNRVRFEINLAAAKRGGLKIGSQLLKLARIVDEAGAVK